METIFFSFRVTDETHLRDLARDILKDPSFDGSIDADTAPVNELIDLVIAEKVGGWLNIGLERLDD
jgi:hypothetical protein